MPTLVNFKRSLTHKGHGQQAVWAEIRQVQDFTIAEVTGVVDMKSASVKCYVKRLQAAGVVVQADDFKSSYRYVLVNDTGRTAPRLRKDGTVVTQGSGNANLWRVMRMNANFSILDLTALANTKDTKVKESAIRDYVGMLLKAGYLRVIRKSKPSTRQTAIYKLIRNTGPQSPQVQRVKTVFDPNLDKVVYTPGVAL